MIEGFIGFAKACSRAKTFIILTSLNYDNFYAYVTVDDNNFCDGPECIYVKYKNVVHQQHVNCLINTVMFFCWMAVNSV